MLEGDARSLSQDAQEALRVRGVKLLLEGWTQVEVAEALGVHERQVRRWQKRYRQGGWEALAKRRRGRDSQTQMVLSGSQQSRLVQAIKSCHPDQLRISALLWTRGAVQELSKPPRRIFAERCPGSRSRMRWTCGVSSLPSQRSRVERGSSSSSTSAPIAACSWRPPLPATWLAGLLFLALAIALLPGALVALFVLASAALALLLIAALGSSAVACKRDGMIAAMIDVAVRHVSLATASRARSGREHPLSQPLAR